MIHLDIYCSNLDLDNDLEVVIRINNALNNLSEQGIIDSFRKEVQKTKSNLEEGDKMGGYNHNHKEAWYEDAVKLREQVSNLDNQCYFYSQDLVRYKYVPVVEEDGEDQRGG